jgi:ElaB/YqjD/DUF883 family membrane-anchored ribosome-binding protein
MLSLSSVVDNFNLPKIYMKNNTTTDTRQALVNDVNRLKGDALQVAQDVRDHANAHVDETRQRVTDTYLSVREDVISHPLSLLGVGFVLGLVMGFRLRR